MITFHAYLHNIFIRLRSDPVYFYLSRILYKRFRIPITSSAKYILVLGIHIFNFVDKHHITVKIRINIEIFTSFYKISPIFSI